MSKRSNENIEKILDLLTDGADIKSILIDLIEVVGCLVLMNHWQRGILNEIVNNDFKFDDTKIKNYKRLEKDLELYESIIWETAPSRLALPALRNFRNSGTLEEELEKILKTKDSHGRVPYGTPNEELDDLRDIVRRIGDVRQKTGYGHAVSLLNKDY